MYKKIERLLALKGVTAYRAAKEIGISSTVFYDWKSGKSKPKIDKLIMIAEYFAVDLKDIINSNLERND